MKSTDMFFSAEDRKNSKTPIELVPSSSIQPQGLAPSPFVVSLWDEEKIPMKQSISQRVNKKGMKEERGINSDISHILNKDEEELQKIENLFRGNGRIAYNKTDNSHINNNHREKEKISPKEIRIPSREEQLQKIKDNKNNYSLIFNKPSQKNNSFFRNFAFWK